MGKHWVISRQVFGEGFVVTQFYAGKFLGNPCWDVVRARAKRYKRRSSAGRRCAVLRFGRGDRYLIERLDDDTPDWVSPDTRVTHALASMYTPDRVVQVAKRHALSRMVCEVHGCTKCGVRP